MSHGYPDWGTQRPLSTIFSIQDLGELAARLGSIVTFDRRGNVLWYDDFESGIEKWIVIPSPGGKPISWSTKGSRNGIYSCLIQTSAAAEASAAIYKYLPYPTLSNIGLEFSFAGIQHMDSLVATLWVLTATDTHRVRIKYERATGRVYYWPDEGDWVYSGITAEFVLSRTLFNTFKLVGDFVINEYKRLIVNDQEVDLSGLALRRSDPTLAPLLAFEIRLYNTATNIAHALFDDVIITQNEP